MKRWALLIVTATTSALFAHPSASSGIAPAAQGAKGNARINRQGSLSAGSSSAKIQTTADPYCAKAHQAEPLLSQTVQVGTDGALVDSLVYVSDGISGMYATPQTPVTLDQKGCVYSPHVIGMMADSRCRS
jgi:hypothetical protein